MYEDKLISDQDFLCKKIRSGDKYFAINCSGIIPQKKEKEENYMTVNALFPLYLSNACIKLNIKLIHISSDCIFDGKKGSYTENDEEKLQDLYSISKFLGEPKDACVIRTSIIGESNSKVGLLEWVKSNKDGKCNGYINYIWNGVTTLQLSKLIYEICQNNLDWKGPRHIFSEKISKYELIQHINKIYNLNIEVKQEELQNKIDRSLSSNFKLMFEIPNIIIQLQELKNWHNSSSV